MEKLSQNLVEVIIGQEQSSTRFESFCNALISELEGGKKVVGTSASWDLGRDGRGVRGDSLFVCASLNDNVDDKAETDVKRLISKRPQRCDLFFCSNQRLSELRCDEIEEQLFPLLANDDSTLTVFGQQQLAQLVIQHPSAFLKSYRAEWDDCLLVLRENQSADAETEGLRLALITSDSEDSVKIRSSLYASLILRALSRMGSGTARAIAGKVSDDLGLAVALGEDAIAPYVASLGESASISSTDGMHFSLTESGIAELANEDEQAAKKLVEGRALIRRAIEEDIGAHLSDEHYDRIWSIFREKITHAFYVRGMRLLSAISTLLGDDRGNEQAEAEDVSNLFEEIATAVAQTSSLGEQRDELRTAVKDLLYDQQGEAFVWLANTCAAYVALCSLGLEATSGRAITQVLRRLALILDTDVVLSLLCEGESEHDAVKMVVSKWKRLGGTVFVADPVLHEVAYHASIADHDYRENQSWLPGSRSDRLRLIDNAFVRGFAEVLAQGKGNRSQWRAYIGQYIGRNRNDTAKVLDVLRQEHGIDRLPASTLTELDLERRAKAFLRNEADKRFSGDALGRALDKADRDAQLYAAMVRYIRTRRDNEPGAMCFLVSSARRLLDVEAAIGETGESRVVVPLSVVLHLVALAPEVRIGLRALSAYLFDEKRRRFSSDS